MPSDFEINEAKPPEQCYPQKSSYTFGEFAGPVFEMGGYGDITIIDPYSGRRLWVGDAFKAPRSGSLYDAMRYAIDIAEQQKFPGEG